jgi:hypothetical protein
LLRDESGGEQYGGLAPHNFGRLPPDEAVGVRTHQAISANGTRWLTGCAPT